MKRFLLCFLSVFLAASCEQEMTQEQKPVEEADRLGQPLSEFSFLKIHNESAVYEDISVGVKDSSALFETPLISSPHLVASFDSHGAEVYVDGVKQISGVTVNDFSKPLTYVVKGSLEYSFVVEVRYSGLPVVFVETPDRSEIPSKFEDWLSDTRIKVYNPDWSVDLDMTTGIRGRGNSTWAYPKKPYALKLDSKSKVLGMREHKRWVLLANWMDRTLLRNAVSFRLSEMTALDYTPRGQFVELILNGEHMGNYYLCEHIKVDENRVNIDELDSSETDGGYLMELDIYYDEINKFMSKHRNFPYMFKDPDEVSASQFGFLQDYVNNLEDALYDDLRFEKRDYQEYIDVDSFIEWWFVMELSNNWEPCHPKSVYMHKDKGGKLTMGPVWDFDWGTFTRYDGYVIYNSLYYERLFSDVSFRTRVKELWNQYEADFRNLPAYIISEAERIRNSEYFNHEMWPIDQEVNKDEDMTFDQAVAAMISSYEHKLEWLDGQISNLIQ